MKVQYGTIHFQGEPTLHIAGRSRGLPPRPRRAACPKEAPA